MFFECLTRIWTLRREKDANRYHPTDFLKQPAFSLVPPALNCK